MWRFAQIGPGLVVVNVCVADTPDWPVIAAPVLWVPGDGARIGDTYDPVTGLFGRP